MDLYVGQKESISQTVSFQMIHDYAKMSGDDNPLHVDQKFAQENLSTDVVAHGMITSALISRIIGTRLPGPGSLWISQEIEFSGAVHPGDVITGTIEIQKVYEKDQVVEASTVVLNQKGETVLRGKGRIRIPSKKVQLEEPKLAQEADYQAVVLGASSSVGLAIIEKLSLSGIPVTATYSTRPDMLQEKANEAHVKARTIDLVRYTAGDNSTLRDLMGALEKNPTSPVIVIQCSSISPAENSVINLSKSGLQKRLETELFGLANVVEQLMPEMKRINFGRIVHISSTAGKGPNSLGWSEYVIGKSATEAYIRAIAFETGSFGVTANIIQPGLMDSGMGAGLPPRKKLSISNQTPINRLITPRDIANTTSFLVSNDSAGITGQTLVVDGGLTP
jgi:3-oxoacyl-[acyl-carrier protein] reductase